MTLQQRHLRRHGRFWFVYYLLCYCFFEVFYWNSTIIVRGTYTTSYICLVSVIILIVLSIVNFAYHGESLFFKALQQREVSRRGVMNKSSSFYSEEYYQKARKQAYKKKPIYREKHKELFDQQHELEVHFYYRNTTQQCQMITYFQLLNEVYLDMKAQVVKKNQDYIVCVEEFIANMKKKISYFHQHRMCKHYLTKDQYMQLGLRSIEDLYNYWITQDNQKQMQDEQSQQIKIEDTSQTVETCNLCPIFIEEFQFNFERSLNLIIKSCEYWQQLNGHQKISKYRWHIEQNLKVLQHQLRSKCEYAPNKTINNSPHSK